MKNLQVNFGLNHADHIEVSLQGNLTSAGAMNFKTDLVNLIEEERRNCRIDITKLDNMDIAGVNALAIAYKTAHRLGKDIIIESSDVNPAEEFLNLTKFQRVFKMQRTH